MKIAPLAAGFGDVELEGVDVTPQATKAVLNAMINLIFMVL
jgi:hypothetical protein